MSGEVPSPPANTSADNDQHRAKEERYWERQVFWQRWTTLITAAAVVAAVVYACFAHQQVTAMNNAVVQQVAATQAARDAANAAKAANEIAQNSLETANRAYISIENAEVKGFPGAPRFSCILRNTGHRPATRIQLIPSFGWAPPWKGKGERPIPRGDFFQPAAEDAGDILAPGETKPLDYAIRDTVPPSVRKQMLASTKIDTRLNIQKVIAGQQELTVLAIVAYIDGFGHARTSWKQLRYEPYFHSFIVDSSHES